jgi:DNA processing protein
MDILDYKLFLHGHCFESPKKAFKLFQDYPTYETLAKNEPEIIASFTKTFRAEAIWSALEKKGVKVLFADDADFPYPLRQIQDPPFALFYKGKLELFQHDMLGVVGPRNPSDYGAQVTRFLVQELSQRFVIVSGFAQGVDTLAHTAALDSPYSTVAVMGTSFDQIYPASNRKLFEQLEEKGLILSEYPPETIVKQHHFPKRNRIISGLSRGVIVTEAGEKSGALITARCAMEQNREVFAVPGPIFSPATLGVHKLIQDGAKLVHGVQDILAEFYDFQPTQDPLFEEPVTDSLPEDLDAELLEFWKLLDTTPQDLDELSQKSGLMIHHILQNLSLLELKNYAEEVPGQRYKRK